MKMIKAFLELFGKMTLSLAIIIAIIFSIITIVTMIIEYPKGTFTINENEKQKTNIEINYY